MQDAGAAVEKETRAKRQAAFANTPSTSSLPSMPGGESDKPDQKGDQKKSKPAQAQKREPSKNVQDQAEEKQRKQAQPAPDQRRAVEGKIQAGQTVTPSNIQMSSKKPVPSASNVQADRTPQKSLASLAQAEKNSASARPRPASRKSTRKDSMSTSDAATATEIKAAKAEEVSKKKPRKLEVRSSKPKPSGSPGTKRTAQRPSG
jgi:hypothetical protein